MSACVRSSVNGVCLLVIIFIIDNLLLATVNDIHRVLKNAEKVVTDSPGLVDVAIRLVIFVLNLPDGQVLLFGGNSNYRRIVINPAN